MKIIINGDAGLEEVEHDFSVMPLSRLFHFASLGIMQARYEFRKRKGFDPYKPIKEQTPQDARDYEKWLEENSDTIEDENDTEKEV
jgi:hypothetical protein